MVDINVRDTDGDADVSPRLSFRSDGSGAKCFLNMLFFKSNYFFMYSNHMRIVARRPKEKHGVFLNQIGR